MELDLKKIKDKYGESLAHLCRDLFPTLLETEGLLYSLIESNFYPSRFLYNDIVNNELISEFQNFINSLVKTNNIMKINIDKTPEELLDSVGYKLYKCKTEKDIQSFKKYYKKGEELCTFRGGRLKTNYVFFVVKKNVDEIKREDFDNPKRQDEYGTSVISIQFTKTNPSYVSIKNRYNHTVNNPDATFNNNLDNIIYGLTKSFENNYGLNICGISQSDFEIPNYIRASDGKFYKYNYEINNIYYCSDNIIIDDFQVKRIYQENERYIVFDYFILDMKEKTISLYDIDINDTFPKYNKSIEKIEIRKEKDKKYIILKKSNYQILIVLDSENRMIGYYNDLILKIANDFLRDNRYLEVIYLDKVKNIGDCFMHSNNNLKYIQIPLLEKCGSYFLNCNNSLQEISFPNLEYICNSFIPWNNFISKVNLPMLKQTGNYFMSQNRCLKHLELPSLIKVGDAFIADNRSISFLYAPYLEEVGSQFFVWNNDLTFLELPNLKCFGHQFLHQNQNLKELRLPCIEEIGKFYLSRNTILDTLEIPEVISNTFIYNSSFKNNFRMKKKILGTK